MMERSFTQHIVACALAAWGTAPARYRTTPLAHSFSIMTTTSPAKKNTAQLVVADSKAAVPAILNCLIVEICQKSIQSRGAFTIALSGGSLVTFLATLNDAFDTLKVNAQYEKWHVVLADERCVPLDDPDSNLGGLKQSVLDQLAIPKSQIYGIQLNDNTEIVAQEYEQQLRSAVAHTGHQLDMAVLGFGPDGHTCSLFPGHDLFVKETNVWVGWLEDSPKPPPKRITLTLKFLNEHTRNVLFCGAGSSKAPILKSIVGTSKHLDTKGDPTDPTKHYQVDIQPAYPCGSVVPQESLTYLVDADAVKGVL